MRFVLLVILGALTGQPAPVGEVKFTRAPRPRRVGDNVTIDFAVDRESDVTICVLNAKGEVVRHLVAGLLGPNAPAPLKKSSLAQTLTWDFKDDLGTKVPTGQYEGRVRLGLQTRLNRYLGWDGLTVDQHIVGVTIDKSGDICVLSTEESWGRTLLTVISSEGKYRRTVIPFSSKTPRERRNDFGTHAMADGTEIPFAFNGHNGCAQFIISALRDQDVVVHPHGHLVLTSANGSLSNHAPAQYPIAVHPD